MVSRLAHRTSLTTYCFSNNGRHICYGPLVPLKLGLLQSAIQLKQKITEAGVF